MKSLQERVEQLEKQKLRLLEALQEVYDWDHSNDYYGDKLSAMEEMVEEAIRDRDKIFVDDFSQLFPDEIDQTVESVMEEIQKMDYSKFELSDLGNEIGRIVGRHPGSDDFLHGVKHGISLSNGTHA